MQFMATGLPSAHIEHDRVVLDIPSGNKTRIEIAMSINQALYAHQALAKCAIELMDVVRCEAEVIHFPGPKRKRKAGAPA